MNMTERARSIAVRVGENVSRVIVGKDDVVELLLVALAAGGHVLVEDVPGTGKTLMARALARSLDCSFRRIQFTPDLLPADVTGVSVWNQKAGDFEFRPGPVFTHILLGDEINRATPRTQSALLEAMAESQVSVDGVTRPLPRPFLVMATQNPVEQEGTFPLPEAQMDRFLMRLTVGYPGADDEVRILDRFRTDNPLETLEPVATAADLLELSRAAQAVYVAPAMAHYIVAVVRGTREASGVELGVSPRGSLFLMRCAQALALLRGRDYILPDDVQFLAVPVLAHRLVMAAQARLRGQAGVTAVEQALAAVPVPAEDVSAAAEGRG